MMKPIRSHRHAEHEMRPIVTVVAWSVCSLVTTISRDKTAEPIEMPLGVWTHGAQQTIIRRVPGSPNGQ